MTLTEAARLLDVAESTLQSFSLPDTFNGGQVVEGFLCQQSDHRYGALVLIRVDGQDVSPQVVYATPKLHYPFGRDEGDRHYRFPKTIRIEVYEKLDGTNVCAYSYANAEGQRFVTYKTRLVPVLQESKFGSFKAMWEELLTSMPGLRDLTETVRKGEYTLSFEMYGYRNSHLISYPVPLTTRLLFGVRQSDAGVMVPGHFSKDPSLALLPEVQIDTPSDLVRFYEGKRAEAESKNKKIVDGESEAIEGTEGYIFYLLETTGKWSQWKCFDGRTRILTEAGWENISKLVCTRSTVKVASVTPQGERVWRPICGWHKTKLDRRMLRVGLAHARSTRSGTFKGVNVTEDHLFLTYSAGTFVYKAAKNLVATDLLVTGDCAPNPQHNEILEGTMLGDACIAQDEHRLRFAHTDIEWAELKAHALRAFPHNIRTTERTAYREGALPSRDVTFRTSIWINQLKDRWYPGGSTKKVPRDLKLTPRVLATWYMDDGCLSTPSSMIFATNAFPKEDVEFLICILNDEGYNATLKAAKNNQWTIRLRLSGVQKLCRDIGAYVPPSMRRKLLPHSPEFDPGLWELGGSVLELDSPRIGVSTMPQKEHSVYCIDVEETHNFVTSAGVVHNCKPSSVEAVHWTSNFLPESIIYPTAQNALESCEGELTVEYVKKLLLEEFSQVQVDNSTNRIEKVVENIKSKMAWCAEVREAYEATGLDFIRDGKGPVMRALSQKFSREKMKGVFSALQTLGLV